MDSSPARTSFVIATRDRADELVRTVDRLIHTTMSPIIVVDNNSRDDTRDLVSAFADGHPDRVRLIALDRNEGAAARNVGAAAATTPYVAFCDDDSWWDPAATNRAERLFDSHPTLALLAAQTVVWPRGVRDPFSDELAGSALGRQAGLPGPSILGFQSCAAVVRRTAFLSAGGFSEVLHFRGEEQLLAVDLAAAGFDLCYCDDLIVYHEPSPTRGTAAAQRARVLRNDFLTCCMRRPADRCLASLRRLLRAAVTGPAYSRAAVEALLRLPAALRRRRLLPAAIETQVRLLEHGSPARPAGVICAYDS